MQSRAQTFELFCREPFRIFFPVGLLLGAVGVSLWILYYAGITTVYPGVSHARLMIEGFIASFVIGFLGTAGPRLLQTRNFPRGGLLALLTLDLLAAGLHLGGANRAGDVTFGLCLVVFVFLLTRRLLRRQDSPPPNFLLVGLSLINALIGTALLAWFENQAYSTGYRIGAALLQEAFPLLVILGVAPFMLALLLNSMTLEELRTSPASRAKRVAAALLAGLVIEATFVFESSGLTSSSAFLRAIAVILYLVAQLPRAGRSFLGDCLRLGLAMITLGFVTEAFWPAGRIAALHIVFITGFAFVILTVAARVILGHSGNAHLFTRRLPFHVATTILIFVAMLSRVTADLAPPARTIHLVAAACLWLAATVIWATRLFPRLTVVEVED